MGKEWRESYPLETHYSTHKITDMKEDFNPEKQAGIISAANQMFGGIRNVRMRFDASSCILTDVILLLKGFKIIVGYDKDSDFITFPNTDNPYKQPPLECGFCHNGVLEVPSYNEKGELIIKQVPCDECNGTGFFNQTKTLENGVIKTKPI